MQVIIPKKVKDNIAEIYNYIARDSLRYANETVRNIYTYIHELEQSPYLGRYVPEIESKQYLELIYKSYRIVYSISKETDSIYIHFVINAKRDLKAYFDSYISNF